jgi:hypothetical protein
VVEAWTQGGPEALHAGGQPLWQAAARALATGPGHPWPDAVAADPRFLEALLPKLWRTDRVRALEGVVLARRKPVDPERWQLLVHAVQEGLRLPWWPSAPGASLRPADLEPGLAAAIADGRLRRPGDLRLPVVFWRGDWPEAVLAKLSLTSIEDARRALTFADGGNEEADEGATVTPGVALVLRAVRDQVKRGQIRPQAAVMLIRRRLGNPFGADASVRWGPAADLLADVRAWTVGVVLEHVFGSLRPPTMGSHQTDPRRRFWARYSGHVESLRVFVSPQLRTRLRLPQMQRVIQTLGIDPERCALSGGAEQALVWMVLVGHAGPVTVVEGNANTSCRAWAGRHALPDWVTGIHYINDVVQGGRIGNTADMEVTHKGEWKWAVQRWLHNRGVILTS